MDLRKLSRIADSADPYTVIYEGTDFVSENKTLFEDFDKALEFMDVPGDETVVVVAKKTCKIFFKEDFPHYKATSEDYQLTEEDKKEGLTEENSVVLKKGNCLMANTDSWFWDDEIAGAEVFPSKEKLAQRLDDEW